jgi:hypothetical protein
VRSALEATLSYLVDHSSATDTLQGVIWWWLLEEPVQWSSADVQAGIQEAVRLGLMIEVRSADGQVRYGLAPGKLPETCKLLGRDPGR